MCTNTRRQNLTNFFCATTILCVAVSVAALVVASVALSQANRTLTATSYLVSGRIHHHTLSHFLDAPAAPLAMTLPYTLDAYAGPLEYCIHSTTAQSHTITIDEYVPNQATWDGTNRVATLGGAIGDGFCFKVISPTRAVVTSVTNVAFSP